MTPLHWYRSPPPAGADHPEYTAPHPAAGVYRVSPVVTAGTFRGYRAVLHGKDGGRVLILPDFAPTAWAAQRRCRDHLKQLAA